ncbi:hypothetical protein RJT34_18039 [Clitoria ternatea]|uniref:Uncharacterized protein n=1 Tax=Clitoria ternatea TaxID=43366 RepID=A0AAN9JA19_CLITE
MSIENADRSLLDQATDQGSQKKVKFSYTREFLLSLSGLDICRDLPSGFDRSLLSEFEDASQDRHRSTGGLSMHNFRRNEYGSSPPTRGDSFSRAIHGKWETRSSGRSDKDSDSQSDLDSDSGKRFGNQSRRSWQGPEHDGLLGSGSFPRPSGYAPGLSAPKFRANDNYQLNRSNEPYHPPRPYKAPHSRRETNDSFNDETFGSLEITSEDRAEEERKRRASFELMRKEQHKAFQEKQKLNPDKNKDDFDITSLVDDDEKRVVNRSNESVEQPVSVASLSNEETSSLLHTTSVVRPLVPPGFASTKVERSLATKTPSNTLATEVGQPVGGDTRGNHTFSINSENKEGKLLTKQADNDQQNLQSTNLNVSINHEKENILNLSSILDIPNIKIGMGDQLRKRSALSEALEASDDNEYIQLNAEMKGKEAVGAVNPDNSNSILYKLFGNASAVESDKSTSIVEEPDTKADETWSPHAFQSSKFAHWFVEEEKKPVDDLTHRPNDLLSLIVGEKGGLQVSNVETTQHIAPNYTFQNPDPTGEHITLNEAHTTMENSEKLYKNDKPEVLPAVLTCEDLEQSIMLQVGENGSSQQSVQDKDFDAKIEQSTPIDNHASQHILSLLQKGPARKEDVELSSILDSADKVHNTEGVIAGNVLDNPGEANADVTNSSKTLTLETLFGSAFMKELQSVGAPLSVQRGSVVSAGADVPESHLFPFATPDSVHPPSGEHSLNRHESGVLPSEKTQQPKINRFEERWLGHGDSQGDVNASFLQSEISKSSVFNGPRDIHLPEEDSLIAASDPLQSFLSAANSVKTDLSQNTTVEITRKLAAMNPAFRDDRPVMRNQEGRAYSHGPFDMREPGIPYQNLNTQRPPQLHPQLNHIGPMFNQVDSHPPHISSYMKLPTPDGMVHHDSPPNHQFPGNMLRPPFHHQSSSGLSGFDPPIHHSMLQQMHMQGNLPPPHLLRGFPRGVPLPPHPSNSMAGFMQEPNPMQGFPFSGPQHPFGGPGMQLQGPEVGGGRNHPEALQRLFEMELRANPKPIHASGGHSQGMYGQELDLGFGYR